MEFRKVFDTIPEQFDKYRPRYSAELFTDLILNTGCDYNAIELGEHLFEMSHINTREFFTYQ